MRIPIMNLLLVALAAFVSCDAHTAAKPKSSSWPDTPAGRMARGWTEAFSAGDSTMRAFLSTSLTKESLEKKPLAERMETYRANRETFGRLDLGSVVSSKPAELAVKLIDEQGKQHEFIFVVQAASPHQLVAIQLRQKVFGHGFGGHH
jgi:hypothetical protein